MDATDKRVPSIVNLILENANTEYNIPLEAGCYEFEFQNTGLADVRWAFEPGIVADPDLNDMDDAFMTLGGRASFNVKLGYSSALTLYLASSGTNIRIQLIKWKAE